VALAELELDSQYSDSKELMQAVAKARKMFDQMDADGNGVLQGAELLALAEWVWSSFHPGGKSLTEQQQQQEGAKLIRRLDKNEDGVMDFDEFSDWFQRTCASVERFRTRKELTSGSAPRSPKPESITADELAAKLAEQAAESAQQNAAAMQALVPLHQGCIGRLRDLCVAIQILGGQVPAVQPTEASPPAAAIRAQQAAFESLRDLESLLNVLDGDTVQKVLKDAQDRQLRSEMDELSGIASMVDAHINSPVQMRQESEFELQELRKTHSLRMLAVAFFGSSVAKVSKLTGCACCDLCGFVGGAGTPELEVCVVDLHQETF
jgi:hypothetical protein